MSCEAHFAALHPICCCPVLVGTALSFRKTTLQNSKGRIFHKTENCFQGKLPYRTENYFIELNISCALRSASCCAAPDMVLPCVALSFRITTLQNCAALTLWTSTLQNCAALTLWKSASQNCAALSLRATTLQSCAALC